MNQNQNVKKISFPIFAGVLILLALTFQNCRFIAHVENSSFNTTSGASDVSTTTTTTTSTTVTTMVPPSPPAAVVLIDTKFYLSGSGNYIQPVFVRHVDDQAQLASLMEIPFEMVGRIQIDPENLNFFAVENGEHGGYFRGSLDPMTGTVGSMAVVDGVASGGFSTLVKSGDLRFLIVSSYQKGVLKVLSLAPDGSVMRTVQEIDFSSEGGMAVKTHSTSYDPIHRRLYVANLGLNRIEVYSMDPGTGRLTKLGFIAVTAPRIVVYERDLDRLFVVTENATSSSFFYGYQVAMDGGRLTSQLKAQLTLPKMGGDLKIDRATSHAFVTVRETGQEAVWGIPLTETGDRDTTRGSPFQIPAGSADPRAIEVSEDGKYLLVTSNGTTGPNVTLRKMIYNSSRRFVTSEILLRTRVREGFRSVTAISRKK